MKIVIDTSALVAAECDTVVTANKRVLKGYPIKSSIVEWPENRGLRPQDHNGLAWN